MPHLRPRLAAGLLVLFTAPSTVAAQTVPSPYRFIEAGQEAGAFAGAFTGDGGRFGFGPGNGLMFGLRYAVHLTNALAVEGTGTWVDATRDVVNPALPEGSRVVGEAPADLVFIEGRLRWSLTGRRTWRGVMPYVFAGGSVGFGMSGTSAVDRELAAADRFEFGTRPGASVGAGTRLHLGPRWALRLDGAFLLYEIGTPSGYLDPDRELEAVAESEWTGNAGLTLGLSWLF